jgi:hypothetical protein
MSLLIVPLLYPDLAGLLNFSHPFQHNFRVADKPGVIAARFSPREEKRRCAASKSGLLLVVHFECPLHENLVEREC